MIKLGVQICGNYVLLTINPLRLRIGCKSALLYSTIFSANWGTKCPIKRMKRLAYDYLELLIIV